MQELHGVKIVNFGAAKGAYSGMAGAEVLEWDSLDSEFKVSISQCPRKMRIDASLASHRRLTSRSSVHLTFSSMGISETTGGKSQVFTTRSA
jgi:hypothetical protein